MSFEQYSHIQALAIDDFKQFLDTVRRILEDIGIRKIDLVTSSNDAIKLCRNKTYDLILCDYNLGEGKRSGFEFLELMRIEELKKSNTIFIMITAETSKEMVLATYDAEPDVYLTKPFNHKTLKQRLDKLMAHRNEMASVYQAIENKNLEEAVSLCKHSIELGGRYTSEYRKTLVNLFVDMQQHEAAENLLQKIIEERRLDWAVVILARVKMAQDDYRSAINYLESIIHQNKYCLEAYDLLVEAYEKLGEPDKGLRFQQDVTGISPRSLQRQSKLGEIAELNYEVNIAANAYLRCVQLGEFSCRDKVENHLNLGRSTATLLEEGNSNAKELSEKALKTLGNISERFNVKSDIETQKLLIESRIYEGIGENEKAKICLNEAENRLNEHSNDVTVSTKIDWVQALESSGQGIRAKNCLNKLVDEYKNDEEALKLIDKLLDEPKSKENRERVASINRKGIGLYNDKSYQESINLLKRAVRFFPKHIGIRLNLAQAIIGYLNENNDDAYRELCMETLEFVRHRVDQAGHQYDRYVSLVKKIENYSATPN